MRRACFAVLLTHLVITASLVHAGEKASAAPTVVVRVKSLDALLQNLHFVVKLVGQEDAASAIEGVIKSKIGPKGVEGINPSLPIGAYGHYGKDLGELHGAILIPIADQDRFRAVFETFGAISDPDNDGIYTQKTKKNVDVFFRFANKYAYITAGNVESIKGKNLPDPAKMLAVSGNATFTVLARLDQIPSEAKNIAMVKLKEAVEDAKKQGLPNETKTQAAFRGAILDSIENGGSTILKDAAEIRFDVDATEKSKELIVNLTITGKPGSELAKNIQALGDHKSPLAGIVSKDVAFLGSFHLALPATVHKAFESVIDEASARSLESIEDAAKKKQAEALFKALMPTAKSGDYQVVVAVLGPKVEHYTFLGAVKLKDGAKLGATAHGLISDAIKQIPENERNKIQLDFKTVGAVKIHKFEVPKTKALEILMDEIAGDKYLYVAFRDEALFLAIGKDALATIEQAVAKTDSVPSPAVVFDADVARLAKWLARTDEQKEYAKTLLSGGQESRIRVSIEGGATLRANLRANFSVLEFMVKATTQKSK